MEAQRSQFAVKLLPSLTDFAFLMPIVFLFGRMDGVKTLLSDCDTGWHIRTGDWIVANHAVPLRDMFSFSRPGQPWYAWEWLCDILWSWLNRAGGLPAVVLFSILLISITFTLVYRLARRRASPLVAIVMTTLAAGVSSIHWLARPHLFTLLLVVVYLDILERVREGRTRVLGVPFLALLPVLTAIWTNLHAGFFVGILMIGAYGAGELLQALFGPEGAAWRPAWRKAVPYFLSAAACVAASLVNPYTYHLHVHMVRYLTDPYQEQHVVEYISLNFHHPLAIFFEALLALGAAAVVWFLSRRQFTQPLLIVVWAHGALLAARNIPIYTITAAPLVAEAIEAWLARVPELPVAEWLRSAARRFRRVAGETAEIEAIGRWHLASAAGVALVAALLFAPHPPKRFRSEFDPKSYPAGAVEMLRRDSSARVFTYDEWGDYLIWRLYPGLKVFIDGRFDFYGADFENQYTDVLNLKYDWEKTLQGYGIDTVLMPPYAPLASALKECRQWRVVYDDGVALVFRRSGMTAGEAISAIDWGGNTGRDREVTKTEERDQAITDKRTKA